MDLICTRYSVGSPSQYLAQVGSVFNIGLDYAMARKFRDQRAQALFDQFDRGQAVLGSNRDADNLQLVALQCLLTAMSYK